MNYESSYDHDRTWNRLGLALAALFIAAIALALATPWISAATAHDDDSSGDQIVARDDEGDDDENSGPGSEDETTTTIRARTTTPAVSHR